MPTVLIVDDDRELMELLSFALRRAGLEVRSALDVPTARYQLKNGAAPDLAVVDVNLGGESGFDLLRELRAYHSMPVIMLTARRGPRP